MKRLRVPDLRRVRDPTRPGPMLTRILRAPNDSTTWHLGWSFGRRFLRLTHTGPRTVPPVPDDARGCWRKPARHDVIVLAGLGRSAQRNRNLVADNAAEIAIGRDRFAPLYRELDPDSGSGRTGPIRAAPPIHRTGHQASCSAGSSAGTTTGPMPSASQLVSALPMIALRPTPILPAQRRSGEPPTDGRWNCSSQAGHCTSLRRR